MPAAGDQLPEDEGDAPGDGSQHPPSEAADAAEGLAQLVGIVVGAARRRQVGRAEAAQEQGQEQVQDLQLRWEERCKNV